MSWILRQLNRLPQPWRLIVSLSLLAILISAVVYGFTQIQSCSYRKGRAEYEALEGQKKAERDQLIGENQKLRGQIAELEFQKQAFKTMAEQGVKLDQEKAKQIDEISAKEATDLENVRQDRNCADRAHDTVALLRTAKPPIILDLAAVIRKQCPAG